MTEEQAYILINLMKKNNELLSEGIILLKRQIALFEQYDAEILFEDEEIREQILRKRAGRS
jgi:hypothetical protein